MPPDAVHSVNPTLINEHMNTMRKGEKTMKKMLALLIAMTMMLTMGSAMAEGIKLTVCMPLGQWTDNFNVLIDFFGNTIDPMRGKPTNAQMIGMLAQRMNITAEETE